MATFGLPDSTLLSHEVQAVLPHDYDGVSKEPVLVQIFESFTAEHSVSEKLRNLLKMSSSLDVMFAGLAETFPETEAREHDFWSLEAENLHDVLFWFRMFQIYGNIFDNGMYLSVKAVLTGVRKSLDDDTLYVDEEILARSLSFTKFLRSEGAYSSVSDIYFFLSHVDREEALKLIASGITIEDYRNYCALECYTYADIFEGQVAEIPDEWKDFLFAQLTEERGE